MPPQCPAFGFARIVSAHACVITPAFTAAGPAAFYNPLSWLLAAISQRVKASYGVDDILNAFRGPLDG